MRKLLFLLALCLTTVAQAYNVTVKAYFHEAPTDNVCEAEHLSAYNVFLLNAEETGSTDLKTAAKNIAQNLDELIANHPTTLYDTEYDYEYEQYGLKFDTTQDDGAMFLVITYGEGDKRYLYVGTRKITEYDDEKTDITLNIDDDSQSFTKWALASSYNAPDDGSLELEVYLYTMPANGDTAPATANASNYQYTVVDAEEVGTTDFDAAVEYIGKNIDALFLANPTEEVESPYYYKGWGQYIFQFTCKVAGEGKKFVVVKYNDSEYYVGAFTADKYETDSEIDDSYGYLFSDWMPLAPAFPAITTNAAGFATFSAAVDAKVATSGVKAYKAVVEGETITLTELDGYIPAGTGVLLYAEAANADIQFETPAADDVAASNLADNSLLPTTTATDNVVAKPAGTIWALGSENAFQKYTGSSLVANRAFLIHELTAASKSLQMVFAETTALSEVTTGTQKPVKMLMGNKIVILNNGNKYNAAGQQLR